MPQRIDIGEVFGLAWRCFRRAFVFAVIYAAAFFGFRTVVLPINLLMVVNGGLSPGDWAFLAAFVYLGIGLRRIVLDVGRGREIAVRRLFAPPGEFVRVVIVGLPTTLLVFLGFALLVFPGLYLYGVFSQVVNLIIDGRARLFDAVGESSAMTTNNLARIVATVFSAYFIGCPGRILARMAVGSLNAEGGERLFAAFVWTVGTSWEMLAYSFATFVIVAVYLTLLRSTDPQAVPGFRTLGS